MNINKLLKHFDGKSVASAGLTNHNILFKSEISAKDNKIM